ncbi:hypothetical protein Gohar_007068 [Gossypium harknessii]|uniref:Uncharacterized protein n=1 Tax=Gossypium harknessii TaxID=34285 RepID=A0A7J9GFD0_9ROSI|nr:hypothetical protein [Gossypium harknessii]
MLLTYLQVMLKIGNLT